jgi:hypothetical protein
MPSILIDLYFLQGLAAHVDQLVTEVQQNALPPRLCLTSWRRAGKGNLARALIGHTRIFAGSMIR